MCGRCRSALQGRPFPAAECQRDTGRRSAERNRKRILDAAQHAFLAAVALGAAVMFWL
jgi:hypothetical protein